MREVAPSHPDSNAQKIQEWLVSYIARLLHTQPNSIDVDATLDDQGLDSLAISGLLTDMQRQFGVNIDTNAAIRNPTIAGLSRYVASHLDANIQTLS